jgi:hypothetical protein
MGRYREDRLSPGEQMRSGKSATNCHLANVCQHAFGVPPLRPIHFSEPGNDQPELCNLFDS